MLWMRLLLLLLTAVAAVAVVVCGFEGFVKVFGRGLRFWVRAVAVGREIVAPLNYCPAAYQLR